MMTALATVMAINPHADGYDIDVSCEQKTSCNSCASQSSCGTGVVSKAIGNKTLHWHLSTAEPLQVGQVVEIGFPERSLVESALIVYMIPLLMMIVGAILGHTIVAPILGLGEGVVILLSIVFTAVGVRLAKALAKPIESKSKQEVALIRVLGEPIS